MFELPTTEFVAIVFLFFMGGSIGSFINVVVYRLPIGLSLSRPGSHCPLCNHPIRWYDNVPIFGWLFLKGRCRDCGARISIRYPIVEAITAVLFVGLAAIEWFPSGIYAYHLLLLCTLFAASLIELDGYRVPVRLAFPAFFVGLLAPAVSLSFSGLIAGLTGAATGAIMGTVASYVSRPKTKSGVIVCLTCVGLFLGYQAAIGLCVLTLSVRLLALVTPKTRSVPFSTWLTLTTLVWIVVRRHLLDWQPIFG